MIPKKSATNRGTKKVLGETLPTNNLLAIIAVLLIINGLVSGYLAYQYSQDIMHLTGEITARSAEARLCVNKPPVLNLGCSATAYADTGYFCDVDGTDLDNDTLYFYDNSTLFDIDQITGEIIFTPNTSDIGEYNITITASDGKVCANSNVTALFTLTIAEPYVPPGQPGGGGGGGEPAKECTPQWECTPWGFCRTDEVRTRTCYPLNNCFREKPAEEQDCIYVLPPQPRRPGIPQFYLCNLDIVDECSASIGPAEEWVYTYKAKNSTLVISIPVDEGVDMNIDDVYFMFLPITRIKPLDVTGDGVDDLEFIAHYVEHSRAQMTVRKIKQLEVIIERPVYIETLPLILQFILLFVYENSCLVLLIVLILAALVLYLLLMSILERKKRERMDVPKPKDK
ncbi:MAG: hypothetical protein V1729_00075 [Candidatus Woesearchaeota archaeon]